MHQPDRWPPQLPSTSLPLKEPGLWLLGGAQPGPDSCVSWHHTSEVSLVKARGTQGVLWELPLKSEGLIPGSLTPLCDTWVSGSQQESRASPSQVRTPRGGRVEKVWRHQLSLLYAHWTTPHPSYRTYLLSSLCAQLGAALDELRER